MYRTFIKPLALDVKNLIFDTLFPITCVSCNQEGFFICPECKSLLKILEHQRCIVCQNPAAFGITHPKCLISHSADQLVSFFDYHDDKVAKIIIQGKYSFIPEIYKILAKMIASKIRKDFPYLITSPSPSFSKEGDKFIPPPLQSGRWEGLFLTPIPLHPSRKRWRGFNQAEILCQTLSAELGLEVADILIRKKLTKTQKDLNKTERQKNVKDAFAIKGKSYILNHKSYILIDDVTTTGATLAQAAKILKQHGAQKIICLTVARD